MKQPPIKNLQQAEAAILRINEIDSLFTEYDLAEAQEVIRVRDRHHNLRLTAGHPALAEEHKLLTNQLKTFAKKDRTNWALKTFKTPFGEIGFRYPGYSVSLIKKITSNWEEAVAKVNELFGAAYIRTKEEVNKELILEDKDIFDAETLVDAGIKIENKEKFFIETVSAQELKKAQDKLKSA